MVMILSMIIYDLNYSRIGERRKHRVDWDFGGGIGRVGEIFAARSCSNQGHILHIE